MNKRGYEKTMGLFSNKKEERIKSNGINIPLPPASRPDNSSRFKDDFDHPFNIDQPISAQIHENQNQYSGESTASLMPTTLGPANNIELGLPTFSTNSNHDLDLDAIEKELSIAPEKKISEDKQENKTEDSSNENLLPEEKIVKTEFDSVKTSEEDKDEFDFDEIPDEIEDIPDFIPELDVEEQMLSETAAFIEEPKEKKSAYIGINSIINVKKNSSEIKMMLNQIAEGTTSLEDNDKKQKELLSKSKTLFEDVERKILFINKILFSEE